MAALGHVPYSVSDEAWRAFIHSVHPVLFSPRVLRTSCLWSLRSGWRRWCYRSLCRRGFAESTPAPENGQILAHLSRIIRMKADLRPDHASKQVSLNDIFIWFCCFCLLLLFRQLMAALFMCDRFSAVPFFSPSRKTTGRSTRKWLCPHPTGTRLHRSSCPSRSPPAWHIVTESNDHVADAFHIKRLH